jgi:glycopeptide antibiotics resistance protein
VAKLVRFGSLALTLALLAAIATCALAPSPNMREMWWIPSWLGEWADRYPNFRNFPVFAAFAALLYFLFRFFCLNTENCKLNTALRAAVFASALGIVLEVAQLLFLSNRHFDWADIFWMTTGAFVGASSAMVLSRN